MRRCKEMELWSVLGRIISKFKQQQPDEVWFLDHLFVTNEGSVIHSCLYRLAQSFQSAAQKQKTTPVLKSTTFPLRVMGEKKRNISHLIVSGTGCPCCSLSFSSAHKTDYITIIIKVDTQLVVAP